MSLSPILLVIGSLVCYQLASKLAPPDVTPWVTLTVVYTIALLICVLQVLTDRQGVVIGDLADHRFLGTVLVLGIAVVGIEYGYLAAHRSGWELSLVGLVGAAGGTAVLALIGAVVFSEILHPRRVLGLALCLTGLAVLAWKQPGG